MKLIHEAALKVIDEALVSALNLTQSRSTHAALTELREDLKKLADASGATPAGGIVSIDVNTNYVTLHLPFSLIEDYPAFAHAMALGQSLDRLRHHAQVMASHAANILNSTVNSAGGSGGPGKAIGGKTP